MQQRDLNRSVARATGEPVSRIARLGFLLADPLDPIEDPHAEELGPWVLDWDEPFPTHEEDDAPLPLDLLLH